jgi:cell wall-associated NlpC family hydrolase
MVFTPLILCAWISAPVPLPGPPDPSEVVSRALSYLGRPYGAEQRQGPKLDCSGFVRQVFAGFGVHLPATSREQAGCGVHVARDALRMGDLVFFSSPSSGIGRIGHVGLVIDVEIGGKTWIVHSSTRGIRIDSLGRAGLANRFLEARRILPTRRSESPEDFGPDVVGGVQAEPFRSDR